MQEFFAAVSTIGLPAAICCFLLWQNAKQDDRSREQQDELRKTIESNTKAIDELKQLVRDLCHMIKEDYDDD